VAIPSPFRTTSAIDPGAQRRAKARAAFVAAMSQPKVVSSGYSLRKFFSLSFQSYASDA